MSDRVKFRDVQGRQVAELDGLETVSLIVRNIDGMGILFTSDGKMVEGQVTHLKDGTQCPHYFYDGEKRDRVTMFRATFMATRMQDTPPGE